jgi:outer membrane lipoprotein carrier protein
MTMNDRRAALAALAIAILCAAASLEAVAKDPDEVLARLQTWLDGTRDLECRFEQTLLSGAFGAGVREVGRLYVKRPGKMRWEYTKPDPKVAVLNDDTAALYLPEDRQLIRGDEAWSSSPLLVLLSGEGRVDEVFEVEPWSDDPESGKAHRLRLIPRQEGQGFVEVIVTVAEPDFSIAEAEVLDEAGNRMHYRFRSVRRNRGVRDDRFVLDPPEGTEILGSS